MKLPAQLTIHDFGYLMDSGTIHLKATDELGRDHDVTLTQHAIPKVHSPLGKIPGRLYFDSGVVEIRSKLEVDLLGLLRVDAARLGSPLPKHAEYTGPLIDLSDTHSAVAEVVGFVESEQYLHFAKQVGDTERGSE